jgi:hypothetical protein
MVISSSSGTGEEEEGEGVGGEVEERRGRKTSWSEGVGVPAGLLLLPPAPCRIICMTLDSTLGDGEADEGGEEEEIDGVVEDAGTVPPLINSATTSDMEWERTPSILLGTTEREGDEEEEDAWDVEDDEEEDEEMEEAVEEETGSAVTAAVDTGAVEAAVTGVAAAEGGGWTGGAAASGGIGAVAAEDATAAVEGRGGCCGDGEDCPWALALRPPATALMREVKRLASWWGWGSTEDGGGGGGGFVPSAAVGWGW